MRGVTMPKFQWDILDVENEEDKADEILIEYDVATYPSDNSLELINKMWGDGKKDITIPDFQRGFVWTIEQSSRLIESFLIGLPVPPVFFYIDKDNKNLVVDGQQRILSVVFYFEGYFGHESGKGRRQVFKLTGLNPKSPFHDLKYTDLDEPSQRKLNNAVLRAINIRQLSPKQENTSIYHIFERLNTGGTPLTPQEIRNVVFRGLFLTTLKKLNNDGNWRGIIGKKLPDKHQKDIELILRIFGLAHHIDKYEKPMSEFLNQIAKAYQNSQSSVVIEFTKNFAETCKVIREHLPSKPFNVRGPLNTSAMDSIFCTILKNLNSIPEDLRDRYKELIIDQDFVNYTSLGTTDPKTVRERFTLVKNILIG
jgi:uncharacterized protein with ParB-like and HNH nuclease domain